MVDGVNGRIGARVTVHVAKDVTQDIATATSLLPNMAERVAKETGKHTKCVIKKNALVSSSIGNVICMMLKEISFSRSCLIWFECI